jgi:hypothetical protein
MRQSLLITLLLLTACKSTKSNSTNSSTTTAPSNSSASDTKGAGIPEGKAPPKVEQDEVGVVHLPDGSSYSQTVAMGWVGTPDQMREACQQFVTLKFGARAEMGLEGTPTIFKTDGVYILDFFVNNNNIFGDYQCISAAKGKYSIRPLKLASSSQADTKATPIEEPSTLKVKSWRCEEAVGGYLNVIGEVQNQSTNTLENILAYATVEDSKGILAKSESLIDYHLLRSGESSPFNVIIDSGGRTGECHLRFGTFSGDTISAEFQ